MSNITIRATLATDWNAVSEIYVEGISTGIATLKHVHQPMKHGRRHMKKLSLCC